MTPQTPSAMRAALDARILQQANSAGIEPGRLRRRLVFQRVLRRLSSDGTWVVKGGYLLESRLQSRFRTTKDLDLATTRTDGVDDLIDRMEDELATDPDGDFFTFVITAIAPLTTDRQSRPGWRFSVTAQMDGRPFTHVRIDVVERPEEVAGAVESLELSPAVTGVGFTGAHVVAVDIAQHAAEKLHAMCRTYSSNRTSTRVKDLIDIALMLDAGFLPHADLASRLVKVFHIRDGTEPPATLPDPPESWRQDFNALAVEVSLDISFDDAVRQAATLLFNAVDGK